MRLLIKFTKNESPVNISNQNLVSSYIYSKCLKNDTEFHDAKSDYSISSLQGGKLNKNTGFLDFPNGAFITISSQNKDFLDMITLGALENIDFGCGMKLKHFEIIEEKFLDGWNHFATLSPFMLRKYESKKEYNFFVLNDENFLAKSSDRMKERLIVLDEDDLAQEIKTHLISKLPKIDPNVDIKGLDVKIKKHPSHKVKRFFKDLHRSDGARIVNYANQCHVSIFCNKKVAEIIYNVGLGQSTGYGFGTIYKTENHHKYRG